MNTKSKSKKWIIGITLAMIMIASIFAVIAPSTTADVKPLSSFQTAKETLDATGTTIDPTMVYSVGETVHYIVNYTNTDNNYNCTLDLWDVLPDGSTVYFANNSFFLVGETKSFTTDYMVKAGDVLPADGGVPYPHIINYAHAYGQNENLELIVDQRMKISRILEEKLPEFSFTYEQACCYNMSFTGFAYDEDGDVVNWSWDFGPHAVETPSGPGRYYNGTTYNDPDSPWCVFDTCGVDAVTVRLSGYDDRGNYNYTEEDVTVPCEPDAFCDVNPKLVWRGTNTEVTFTANGSSAWSGLSLTYHWEFDDGYAPQNTQWVTRVVDSPTLDQVCGTLTVNDSHCNDTCVTCVDIMTKTNCTPRVYGRLNEGAGDPTVIDEWGGNDLNPENPPYTNAMAPFYPQAGEAPRKDFITFDPVLMFHNDDDWDNDGNLDSVYMTRLRSNIDDTSEKIFKRMWYEPTEWYKDEDGDGELDLLLRSGGTITATEAMKCENFPADIVPFNIDDSKADIYAPSIKQEFTFMFIDTGVTTPQPIAVPTGHVSSMLIPMASRDMAGDNGIDSFDIDGPGGSILTAGPDKVWIESEYSLGMDIDNDGRGPGGLEQLDEDLDDLSGDETLVLLSDWMWLELGDEMQFFDHKIVLYDVFGELPVGPEVIFLVYYQGDTSPEGELRSWPSMPGADTKFFEQGFENTGGDADGVQGPFFVQVDTVDGDENKAFVRVGRIFGNTYANIGANPWWNQKQFYVDKVCYNVVAIKCDGNESFKYVTFRQKLPKVPIKIPNHSQHLKGWSVDEILPEMPQYNMNHDILKDVQEVWTYPIVKVPSPRVPVPALAITYLDETLEPRFHGELKEILYEDMDGINSHTSESWMIEWIQTLPWEYTTFALPDEENGGLYLFTSAFWANESLNVTWDGAGETDPIGVEKGQRLKFWFRNCSGPFYVDWDGALRVYGRLAKGAGDPTVNDLRPPYFHPENPPYTDAMAPFWPQADEAPDKDFVTFNPILMYHNDRDWNNDGFEDSIYAQKIRNNGDDASEKIFKRMWYEPTEWYKDENYSTTVNGELDLALSNGSTITASSLEDPNVLFDLMMSGVTIVPANAPESVYDYNDAADIYAPSIKQEFTFMMLDNSVCPEPVAVPTSTSSMLIPMASWEDDNGLDSFDADGDGQPDRVIIESEVSMRTLIMRQGIHPMAWQGDRDGTPEYLDMDNTQLSGNEMLVLRLDEVTLSTVDPKYNDTLQFFDYRLKLVDVAGEPAPIASFGFWYQANPASKLPANPPYSTSIGINEIKFFEQGFENTGGDPVDGVQGPFFIIVTNADGDQNEKKVSLIVGRFFGETYANIGTNPWWNQKQFYVDGVCYNVVAIKTEGAGEDSKFKYIVFRQKLPKVPIKIPNHSQYLLGWPAYTTLPEMPQYNMKHDILLDIQKEWTTPSTICDKLGDKMAAPPLNISWKRETTEPRFHGELKEIYYENNTNETWMVEWFQTIPYEYTAFDLPLGHGLYLLTSAFGAPEACAYYHDLGDPIGLSGDARLKFWYDPADPTDIYVTRPPTITTPLIDEYYDRAANGGNANGQVDIDELNKAWSDYVFSFGNGRYPFGEGGIYTAGDLAWMISQY